MRRILGTSLKLCGWSIVSVLLVVLLGGALLYMKLSFGSLPLQFLVEPIRQALASELDGVKVDIGDAELKRGAAGGLELRLKKPAFASAGGDGGIEAAEAIVEVDVGALWSGHIAASRIVLLGPRFTIAMSDEGMGRTGQQPTETLAAQRSPALISPKEAAPSPPTLATSTRLDVARVLAEAMAHLRRGNEAASHLKAIGVRDAIVEVETRDRRSVWNVPEMNIDLDHRQKRSVVSGQGHVSVAGEAFGVRFRLDESEKTKTLKLETEVEGVRPASLARNLPHLGLLAALDVGVNALGELELSSAGEVLGGRFHLDLARGGLVPSVGTGLAIAIDGGRLNLTYSGADRRFELLPSTIQLAGNRVRIKGSGVPIVAVAGLAEAGWQVELDSIDGTLAPTGDASAVAIDRMSLRARLWPATGASELTSLVFKAGSAELEARGTMVGGDAAKTNLEGRVGPVGFEAIKALWPQAQAPSLRETVFRSVLRGQVKGGSFRMAMNPGAASRPSGGLRPQFTFSLEAEDLVIATAEGVPPVIVPRALIGSTGEAIEITIPEASLTASANRKLLFKAGSIVLSNLDQPQPQADVSGKAQAALATLAELASRDGVALVKTGQIPAGTDGKVEIQWRATFPVVERLALTDMKLDAKARITEGRIPNVVGQHDVTGATITIGASERTIDVKGDLLLAGIAAKLSGQWILGEGVDRQAPIVLSTRLDTADRRLLGLTIDDIVQGEIPIELQLTPATTETESARVQFNADLTAAELMLDGVAWRKPAGRAARLTFDAARAKKGSNLELQNFRISGEGVAIEGTVYLGPDGQPQAYKFPGFSLNVVSNLSVEGVRRADKVWEVTARGRTFDGGELMRSLYEVDIGKRVKSTGAIDLDARIDTVIGVNDTTVKQVHVRMSRRGDQMTALEFAGLMDGGQPIEARLQQGQGRVVHVRTPDAGQALKTIGFYSSMLGGKGELWVGLDARGSAERSGQIQVSKFRILGDPIVSELVQNSDESRPAIAIGKERPARRVVREEISFDTLRGSFATGSGQVAIESLNAAGPLIGASVRGKMDFRTRSLSLGGTYVPLSGLNRALAGIPLFGELLTGPKGDGIIGITFAVDGPMSKPNVIINPLSMVAPGVLREIFQMAPDNPRVTPSEVSRPPGAGPRVRSSDPESHRGPSKTQPGGGGRVIDGWTSERAPPTRQ